jgi:hypothetical protein
MVLVAWGGVPKCRCVLWPLVREKQSGELFAVDSSASVNGENPTVQSAASFYVPDSSSEVKPPETSRYADSDDTLAGFSASR